MKILESKITDVTVYADRAQVTRQAGLETEKGSQVVVFDHLPEAIDQDSIRVSGTGRVLLRDVQLKRIRLEEIPDQQVKALKDKADNLKDQIEQLDRKIRNANNEKQFVQKIKEKLTTEGTKDNPAELDPKKWIDMVAFYRRKLDELDTESWQNKKQRDKLKLELNNLSVEISLLGNRKNQTKRRIEVRLEAETPEKLQIKATYVVRGAQWTPFYDLRADSREKKLHVTYHANVLQNTGEDWSEVNLRLSTAQVQKGGQQPELNIWRVGFFEKKVYPELAAMDSAMPKSMSVRAKKKKVPAAPPAGGSEGNQLDAMMFQQAHVETGATAVVFAVGEKNTIKSNKESQKVMIFAQEFPAEFRYSGVPKLSEHAYLTAKATNTTDYPFLPGAASVFLDNQFVAKTHIKLIAPTETFTTDLGIDEAISIKHKLIKRYEKNEGLISKKTVLAYEYRIEIKNNKKTQEKLTVRDQMPLASHDDIKIELTAPPKDQRSNFEISEENFVAWKLQLKPGEEKTLPFEFAIEYPRDKTIDGV